MTIYDSPTKADLRRTYVLALEPNTTAQVTLALVDRYKSLEQTVRNQVAVKDRPAVMATIDDMTSTIEALETLSPSNISVLYSNHFLEFKHHAVANLADQPSHITDPVEIIHAMEEALSNDG